MKQQQKSPAVAPGEEGAAPAAAGVETLLVGDFVSSLGSGVRGVESRAAFEAHCMSIGMVRAGRGEFDAELQRFLQLPA